jgi:hypothetical protein
VFDIGARKAVDGDGAPLVQLHARLVQAQRLDVRLAAGGEHHHLGLHLQRVGQMADQHAVGAFLDLLMLTGQQYVQAAQAQLIGQVRAQVLVETAQEVGAAIDQGDVDAQAVEDAGELDGDIAAADDHHPLGQLGQQEGLFRGDDVLDPGQVGPRRPVAGGDQDLPGRDLLDALFPLHFQRVRIKEAGRSIQDVGAGLGQVGGIDAGEPRDLAVLGHPERLPVEGGVAVGPAIAARDFELAPEVGRIDHQLLGHAAADDAGAADAILLGHRHARAGHGRQPGGAHAAGARADDEEIVVVVSHWAIP